MQHIKLFFLLGFALVVHIQHGLYTLRNVYHASYWGQFTVCSVWRETLTGGMNATLDRGNSFKDTVLLMGMLCLQEKWHKDTLKIGYNNSRTSHEHFRQPSWHASSGKRSPWRYSSSYIKVTILQYVVLANMSQLTPFERRWEDGRVGLEETDTRQAGRDRTVYHYFYPMCSLTKFSWWR